MSNEEFNMRTPNEIAGRVISKLWEARAPQTMTQLRGCWSGDDRDYVKLVLRGMQKEGLIKSSNVTTPGAKKPTRLLELVK